MTKHRLLTRLRQLKLVELLNVLWLPFGVYLIARNVDASLSKNFWIAAACNSFLLLQGSVFWFLVSYQVQTGKTIPFTKSFVLLKWLDRMIIMFALVFFPLQTYQSNFEAYSVIFFLVLSLLEYLNYFEVQLMYDHEADQNYVNRYRRLKTAKLKQLMTNEATKRTAANIALAKAEPEVIH